MSSSDHHVCGRAGHAVWVSAEMYSAPSIVLQSRRHDGSMHVFDDFREAYAWLRHNTDPSAKVRTMAYIPWSPTPISNAVLTFHNPDLNPNPKS